MVHEQDERPGRVGLGQPRVQGERPLARPLRLRRVRVGGGRVEGALHGDRVGERRVGQRVLRVDGDGASEHLPGVPQALASRLVVVLTSPQVVLVRPDVGPGDLAETGPLPEDDPERLHDSVRDLVLDGEQVAELPVEASRPQLVSVGHVHQLCGDPDPVFRPLYAPLEDGSYAQRPADLTDILVPVLEHVRRRPRRHAEAGRAGQRGRDLVGDPVAQEGVIGLHAPVREGEHRHGRVTRGGRYRVGRRRRPSTTVTPGQRRRQREPDQPQDQEHVHEAVRHQGPLRGPARELQEPPPTRQVETQYVGNPPLVQLPRES